MGGAFDITLEDDGKKLRIQFRQQDSGNELMTYGDVAAFLNLELSTVRQMTKTRSRNKTGFPAPVDIGGPKIRRSQLLKWIQSKTKARAGKRTKE
jgi:predicted DNA-binding transcriptional regulator AlpA